MLSVSDWVALLVLRSFLLNLTGCPAELVFELGVHWCFQAVKLSQRLHCTPSSESQSLASACLDSGRGCVAQEELNEQPVPTIATAPGSDTESILLMLP
eukprot:6249154-Amphidinium_carterae.1